ncbi:hypothetical protein E2C01_004506 [Portunus trituberculatus]|uniref:Uncharacterized protein n=1 Tax=Portunus trituberculatus TaxID=210409 RepID=A0A5B7CQ66_PORTR|nr:hypothetical protein [Portunus trituberculatus]
MHRSLGQHRGTAVPPGRPVSAGPSVCGRLLLHIHCWLVLQGAVVGVVGEGWCGPGGGGVVGWLPGAVAAPTPLLAPLPLLAGLLAGLLVVLLQLHLSTAHLGHGAGLCHLQQDHLVHVVRQLRLDEARGGPLPLAGAAHGGVILRGVAAVAPLLCYGAEQLEVWRGLQPRIAGQQWRRLSELQAFFQKASDESAHGVRGGATEPWGRDTQRHQRAQPRGGLLGGQPPPRPQTEPQGMMQEHLLEECLRHKQQLSVTP